jgi:hypothetical protein
MNKSTGTPGCQRATRVPDFPPQPRRPSTPQPPPHSPATLPGALPIEVLAIRRSSAIRARAGCDSPIAANSRDGCGPELPMGIGNGGSRSAVPRNRAIHLDGLASVHANSGTIAAGAASTAFPVHRGDKAIAAAHTPNPNGSRDHRRGCAMALVRICRSPQCGPPGLHQRVELARRPYEIL